MPFRAAAQTSGYSIISSYSGAETGVHGITYDTAQDKEGLLYFAGTSLLTFDGERWTQSKIPDSFAIRSLSFGPDGRLWAGTMSDMGWFEQNEEGNRVFKSIRDQLPATQANFGEVWGISADRDGTSIVCTNSILRWTGQHFLAWDMPSKKKLFSIRSNGTLFVHCVESGLYEINASGPRLVLGENIVGSMGILWVERTQSRWLFVSSKGFFAYDGREVTPFAPEIGEFLQNGTLSCATRLPDGRIAVGTLNHGIAFLHPDGRLDFFLNDKAGLPSPHILSLHVSNDGDLWATTGSHILKIDVSARSSVFDERAGLPRQTYRKICKANDRVVVANESGIYELPPGANRFESVDALPGRWQHIRGVSSGLLATGFRGALVWDGAAQPILPKPKLGISTGIPTRADPRELLLADTPRIVRVAPNHEPSVVVESVPDTATSIAEDVDGRLWIGTLGRGLFVASPEVAGPVQAANAAGKFGIPELTGQTHTRTNAKGTVVVFSNTGAWQKPKSSDRFVPITNFPIRALAAISEMAEDGTTWVAFENSGNLAPCVGRVSPVGGSLTWEPHAVDRLIDVGSPRSIYAEATPAGETVLWIGTTQAVLRHVVQASTSNDVPRSPRVRAFVRHATTAQRKPIEGALEYATEVVEFEFAAPEFSRRSLLRIETRIDGIDHDWTPLGPGSRRELTAVRDGHYTVRARVVAETGATSQETTFSFDVLPPLWRTAPFVVAVAVLLLPLAYGVYVLRVRALRRRNAELEQKVRERTEELVAANAAKTQFVANMSHDIRNPLNGIVGLAIALEDTRLAPRQREIVATLRECTTYLSSLVDDVLDFASIEAGRVELRPRAYAPAELLASIVETLKVDATASGAKLSVNADSNVPNNLLGDAGRIQQILVNFVSNALKYAGGHIELSVQTPANAPGEIEFAVTDQGPGISVEEQAKLFTKFSRLRQKQGGEEIPGTGLGLASCRLLADIMGGSVGLESQPGKGARFSLRLPMTVASEPTTAATAHLPNTAVLLVEDTDYNAWAATAVLSRIGLSCERARTGAEALELFAKKRFNVVLLDRNLPDMDGTEVARRMRAMESDGLQAVLLAVTAYCTAEDRELCLRAGMDAFVGKPLTPEKLRNILIAAGRRLLAAASVQAAPEAMAIEVDTSLLAYLSDGSTEGLQLQVDRFIATLDEFEAALMTAIAAKDLERVRTSAHRLLGQAKMVGGAALAAATQDLELAARAGDGVACESLLPRVHVEAQSLKEAMRHRRAVAPSA